jgi:hypothetical protein
MKRPAAVFTVAQNEPVFLPLWLRYYTKHFEPADVYVLDHDSDDGSVAAAWRRYRPSVVQVHRADSFDHRWLLDTVKAFQAFLLQSYEQVLFAEADEFVVADPLHAPGGLAEFVRRNDRARARCDGFDVVQPEFNDRPIDLAGPLLGQGRRMVPAWLYSKTLLAREPLPWGMGFHDLTDHPVRPCAAPGLLLFHLRRFDRDVCLARNQARLARKWAAEDLAAGRGAQSRLVSPTEFDAWFYAERYDKTLPIPERFHEVI